MSREAVPQRTDSIQASDLWLSCAISAAVSACGAPEAGCKDVAVSTAAAMTLPAQLNKQSATHTHAVHFHNLLVDVIMHLIV